MHESDLVPVFVYGTLRRGGRYHDAYCRTARRIVPAWVWGRLYDLPDGYPMLQVPEELILVPGSGDAAADTARLREMARDAGWPPRPPDEFDPSGWNRVQGEWIELAEAPRALARLDRLEGYHAERSRQLFDRVILPVHAESPVGTLPTWVYVAPGGVVPPGAVDCGCRW